MNLTSSRKFWAAVVVLIATGAAVVLRIFDKIPADAFTPTVAAVASIGSVYILGTAAEDAAAKLQPFSDPDLQDHLQDHALEAKAIKVAAESAEKLANESKAS